MGCSLFIGAVLSLIGGVLQAAAQSSDFMIVSRVVTGLGTGALTGITPVLVSETSTASHRGGFLGYVFIANYLGIAVAYWIYFGMSFLENGNSDVQWRFLLAFQCFPALLLVLGIKLLPDSPRYLASVGRLDDAREVLEHVRGANANDRAAVEHEFLEIAEVAKKSQKSSPIQFAKILVGRGSGSGTHLGRRAWLCMLLQIMGSWTGITAVTAYAPVLLSAAGYDRLTQNGLTGGLSTVGIVGTIISAQIVDRLGRRTCLMGGSLGLFIVNLVSASVYEGARAHPERASSFAPAAVTMLFLFNVIYAATWGTVAFLIPTEIWSSDMRAQGNGFGITGWAIGVGWTVLVNPIMFKHLENRTYFLFAGLNLLWIPVVYLCELSTGVTIFFGVVLILPTYQFTPRRQTDRWNRSMSSSQPTAPFTGPWSVLIKSMVTFSLMWTTRMPLRKRREAIQTPFITSVFKSTKRGY